MTDPADLPPRDIPEDLVAYALIGGPGGRDCCSACAC